MVEIVYFERSDGRQGEHVLGHPRSRCQAIRSKLTAMATEIESARVGA